MICSQQLWSNSILDYEKDKSTVKNIYHKGWIDFNKNGVKDIYEDSYAPLEARVQNLLSQMTLEEKVARWLHCMVQAAYSMTPFQVITGKTKYGKMASGILMKSTMGLAASSLHTLSLCTPRKDEARHSTLVRRKYTAGNPGRFHQRRHPGLCHDRATYFPAQCGQGATWNKELIAQIGEAEAREASVLGYTNIYSPSSTSHKIPDGDDA